MTARRTATPADGPVREWVTFDDPRDRRRRWLVDVTFLSAPWRCLFGCGCPGVLTEPAPELSHGCCSYGAHFNGDADRARVERVASRLRPDEWQYAAVGRRRGVAARVVGGGWRTRLVEGACIFLNRPGFPTGAGCALHQHAVSRSRHPMKTKPDVCWQLPLRKEERSEDDGTVTVVLSEFGRSGWGPGGQQFAWWCTEAPEAFTGGAPVYRTQEPELRAMVGDVLYERIAAYLDGRRGQPVVLHPAVRRRPT
jgi:hypothetical protein